MADGEEGVSVDRLSIISPKAQGEEEEDKIEGDGVVSEEDKHDSEGGDSEAGGEGVEGEISEYSEDHIQDAFCLSMLLQV